MSEYMEKFSSSRLFGAPPGYVGYEEGGKLTEQIRRRPYSVVLFDEIEKAHPDIFNVLLQVLDDGCLTDSLGRKIDFKNTVVIMTSNIGTKLLQKDVSLGFQQGGQEDTRKRKRDGVLEELRKAFSPEFLNRVDEVLVFHSLEKEHLHKIIDIQLLEIHKRLREQGLELEISEDVKNFLIEEGYQPQYGARPMRRAIQKHLSDPLSDELIKGRFRHGRRVNVVLRDDVLEFVEVEEEALASV